MKKNYNYTRRKLYLPEYGRHIQEMVDSLFEIEDRTERTRQAKAVIAVMGNLNPLLRDTADFTHKLWDHLFIMSDFQLDVDSPYPLPSRQDLMIKPKRLDYPQSYIPYKHYGKYVTRFIKQLSEKGGEEQIGGEVHKIAVFMRYKSFEYNQEHPSNEIITKDIRRMSDYNIEISEDVLNNTRPEYKLFHTPYQRQGKNNARQGQKGKGTHSQQQKRNKNVARHNSQK
ncbi:MAG: DUF4290 domain-containing protein [Alistipes sp.]|nr:DUF4290 domain-containing protein [Alistipes sp.]